MARQLRQHMPDGWYHITTRGMRRQDIFIDDRDREHFIELLEGMVSRYGVVLHAYVLMGNHVARMNCGLTIAELASLAGTESTAASKAIQRMKKRLSCDRKLKSILRKVSADTSVSGI